MRKLYLVPVLHMSADMGSLAPALDETARGELGPAVWQRHKEAVSAFWDSIGQFFNTMNVKGSKIYQDGMIADGADGLEIIREGARQGSKNYQIVEKLLERGAVLVMTEDTTLVKQEYTYIAKIAQVKSKREKEALALRYKLARDRLLRQRDDFIARRIRETLSEGETGILFIGAYHNILPRLPGDIQVVQVKNIAIVREYYKALVRVR